MSDNWVVQNLEKALNVWNDKLSEIWQLITQSPTSFKGGTLWNVVSSIHGALQAIGYALLVLFFVIGVMKTCGSLTEVKRPEHALRLFVRFALAKGVITYGMDLMLAFLEIVQGVISAIMQAGGFGQPQSAVLPAEIVSAIEDCGFFESIPLWAVTLIGGLFIWVLSFQMILSVYGRFFKMFMYTAIAPIPLSTFAGEPPPEHWQELSQELRFRLPGRSCHRSGLRDFLRLCILAPGGGCKRGSGQHGLELHWRDDFQYADPGRLRENGRPGSAGDDGAVPIPTDEAVREVENRLLGVETNITNWQRRQNSNNNFSAVVPYDMELQRKESKEFLDDLTTRDQRMIFGILTMVITADTKEQLDMDTDAVLSTARKRMCQMAILKYQQMDGLNTVLPIGTRKLNAFRTLTTESLAVFMPFKVQEIMDKGGIYFGENAISHNLIMCNKENLLNQSAFLLGVPGSGKSFSAKELMTFLMLNTEDDILVCDPE